MSVIHGSVEASAAVRSGSSGWRDLRLWIGVGLVAASVLVGARLLDGSDDTVTLWAVRTEMAEGDVLSPTDLVAREVRFVDATDVERYLPVAAPLPADSHLVRGLGSGELVPRSVLGTQAETGLLNVPISVPGLAVAPEVRVGSVVDVWVTEENGRGEPVSRPVLRDVVVIAAPAASDAFGAAGDRQLVLGVEQEQERELGKILAGVGDGGLTVVSHG